MPHTLKESDLAPFDGSENWYKHPLSRSITYTDGVQYMAEHGGAYWLLDLIVLAQTKSQLFSHAKLAEQEFQVWKLAVTGSSAVLSCEDGDYHAVYKKNIEFTDFPLPEIEIWLENNVMMLPGER